MPVSEMARKQIQLQYLLLRGLLSVRSGSKFGGDSKGDQNRIKGMESLGDIQ